MKEQIKKNVILIIFSKIIILLIRRFKLVEFVLKKWWDRNQLKSYLLDWDRVRKWIKAILLKSSISKIQGKLFIKKLLLLNRSRRNSGRSNDIYYLCENIDHSFYTFSSMSYLLFTSSMGYYFSFSLYLMECFKSSILIS